MGLNDLVNDRKPQPRAAFEFRLQRFENLGALLRVETDSSVGKSEAQPKRFFFDTHGQRATSGHGSQSVVTKIPENLLDLAGIDSGAQLLPVEGPHHVEI